MNDQLEIYERLGCGHQHADPLRILLTHEQRDKGRLKVTSTEGTEVRIFLERGKPLQVGEYLRSRCGRHVLVEGAAETVTRAECRDWDMFSRACYHLGNRHVKVQIGHSHRGGASVPWLRIQPDHVLEEMLEHLGLTLVDECVVFIPENGAYSHGQHHHH